MDTASALVVPLSGASALGNSRVGGKAAKLSDLIAVELRRQPLSSMRWEELWDSALRIRAAFRKWKQVYWDEFIIENQLLRAATVAAKRLERSGRLDPGARVTAD